jgi:hypothetical protein
MSLKENILSLLNKDIISTDFKNLKIRINNQIQNWPCYDNFFKVGTDVRFYGFRNTHLGKITKCHPLTNEYTVEYKSSSFFSDTLKNRIVKAEDLELIQNDKCYPIIRDWFKAFNKDDAITVQDIENVIAKVRAKDIAKDKGILYKDISDCLTFLISSTNNTKEITISEKARKELERKIKEEQKQNKTK